MVRIRLFRVGKKNQPAYKIVVTPKENPPQGGRFLDRLGHYNPVTKECKIDAEKAKKWLDDGAQPSDTVYNLFVKEGIIEGEKRPKHKKGAPKKENKKEKKETPDKEEDKEESEDKKEEDKEKKKDEKKQDKETPDKEEDKEESEDKKEEDKEKK